jgi:hypothetical protein
MSTCCDEPGCRRTSPVGIYLADLSGRAYAVTRRRVVTDHGNGTATFAAADRHDITAQLQHFIAANAGWVQAVLAGAAAPAPVMSSGAPAAGVYDRDTGGTGEPRSWDELRSAALAAVRESDARKTTDIIGVVLGVIDEETVSRMAAELTEETRIRSMDFRNGAAMDIEPSRTLVARWVGAARGMLGDAPNYSETEVELGRADPPGYEMTVGLAGQERFVFRLQRAGRLTPHQARMLAEQRADHAEQRLAEAEAELARLRSRHEDGHVQQ